MLTSRTWRRASAASACVAASVIAGDVFAGAWTRDVGDGFSSQELRYFLTDQSGDEAFEQASFSAYAEYGLFDNFTVGFKLDQSVRLDPNARGSQSGRAGAFGRIGVWRGESGDVAAVEVGGSIPIGGFQSPAAPAGDDANEIRASALYGRGFQTDYGGGWFDGGAGEIGETGGRASEIKVDLTAGFRPDDDWLGIAQVFTTIGLRNERSIVDTDFDTAKVKLSIGRKIFGERTLLLGVARDVYTRGTSPGWEASLTIWAPFDFNWRE